MSYDKTDWIRVRKDAPCVICQKPDYCGVSADGTVAHCMRVESAKKTRIGGYIHYLGEKQPRQHRKFVAKPKPRPPKEDIFELHVAYRDRCIANPTLVRTLANQLGVTPESLTRLQVGYDPDGNYSFPMSNANEKVIGIKLRAPNGSKFCVAGSQLAIYWPIGVEDSARELLVITEGESDCAALLSMGFQAIGRPSCTAGVEIIQAFLSKGWRDVIIMADNDEPKERPGGSVWRPGLDGANALAAAIARLTRSTKVIKPPSYKDVRQWYRAGATKAAIEVLAKHTRPWSKQ